MIKQRLEKLRAEIADKNYFGYIIPSNDEYMSEYTPDHAKRLEYITGFTGSNGIAVIFPNIVLFFTDGRYLAQSRNQLDFDLFEVHDLHSLHKFDWSSYVSSEDVIAYDPNLFTRRSLSIFHKLTLLSDEINLLDLTWDGRPKNPNHAIYEYKEKYAGQSRGEKLNLCHNFIEKNKSEALLITDSDSICWLLNLRSSDVEFTPAMLSNSIVTLNKVYLFVEPSRFDSGSLSDNIVILPQAKMKEVISQIDGRIIFDESQINLFIASFLKEKESISLTNPCMMWKACKNKTEIEYAKLGHIEDAVAICEMLAFLDTSDLSNITEYDIGVMLTEMRSKGKDYIYDSFPAICGFQGNGAMIHYKAEEKTSKVISGSGLLLIDSGGQYMGATTDITRTVAIGDVKKEYIEYYTRVLKGHIALGGVKFPTNKICGSHLDVLARQYLWQIDEDYAHGTGHGVGNFLSVHEGPQNISLSMRDVKLSPGMILSNEPGYYRENEFGIRVENLMYVKSEDSGFSRFEMLTLVPYAKNLIDFDMLNSDEILFLRDYYQRIDMVIRPLLSSNAQKWLDNQIDIFN